MFLGVNIDHIATIRNARLSTYPSLTRACNIIKDAGGDIITIHLREDRRHIKDADALEVIQNSPLPVNFEMAPTEEMLKIALQIKPKFVCLVPEKREEITTEGGLNVVTHYDKIKNILQELQQNNILTSLFIEPSVKMVEVSAKLNTNIVELHTGEFALTLKEESLKSINQSAILADTLGLKVHAGHGLDFTSANILAKTNAFEALHIGHFLITESIYIGLFNAVKQMKEGICSF